MLKFFLLALALESLCLSVDSQMLLQESKNEFHIYKQAQNIDFDNYKETHYKAIASYKHELEEFWERVELSTPSKLVSYTPDKKTRTNIDFENEEIVIETIAKDEDEAKINLKTALAKAVIIDTKTYLQTDPLQQRLSKIAKPNEIISSPLSSKPILAPILFKNTPTKESVRSYVNEQIQTKKIKTVQSNKIKHSKIYTSRVTMPPNSIVKRSKIYYDEIKKEARKNKIPMPLIFAIIHSESSFNPLAKSHIPAYGLMQIVPESAGKDTYFFLYKKKRIPSSNYLYNSSNNIKMGTAYLHILYYRYLRYITDEDSRLYCTIAAYNTGAGNVARTFVKNNDVKAASKIINKMEAQEVYRYLLKNLKYDETKYYLQKVVSRIPLYHRLYGV